MNIDKKNEQNRLFLMSLSQPIYEPLKIGLLEKAMLEYNDILSALLLANIYISGVEHNGKVIIPPNTEKAFDIYSRMCKHDPFGVCEWELGWFYENKLISDGDSLSCEERLKKAKHYYDDSAQKGYAKAFNSLGKFSHYGMGGVKKSYMDAMMYYIEAAKLGDIYAIMNCGLTSMEQYYTDTSNKEYLEEAEQYFLKAALYNNNEGLLQLGIINEIKMSDKVDCLHKAKEYYIRAFLNVENQYSATAYFRLGKLINNNPELTDDSEIIDALNTKRFNNLAIECFTRAYEIFQTLDITNGRLDGKYKDCYIELVSIFTSIN